MKYEMFTKHKVFIYFVGSLHAPYRLHPRILPDLRNLVKLGHTKLYPRFCWTLYIGCPQNYLPYFPCYVIFWCNPSTHQTLWTSYVNGPFSGVTTTTMSSESVLVLKLGASPLTSHWVGSKGCGWGLVDEMEVDSVATLPCIFRRISGSPTWGRRAAWTTGGAENMRNWG